MSSLPQPERAGEALPLPFRGRSLARGAQSRWVPPVALGALLVTGALVLAHLTRGTTFYADEWDWILGRRHGGISTFLDPHQQHLSFVPLLVYRALFATVGIRHYWPYLAVLIATHLVCVALLYRYARPRVGPAFALLAAALILFFGPGSIDFLWVFQLAWVLVMACAIGALLALDRHDRLGDVIASILTGVALASAGPGLAVALALAVEMVWTRGRRGLWMAGVPLGLFALWWVLYQQAGILRDSLFHLASFTATAAATSLTALTGLLSVDVSSDSSTFALWGPMALVLGLAGLVWFVRSTDSVRPRLVTLLLMPLAFWVITALGRGAFQAGILVLSETGDESRYTYVGGVLLALLLLELARDWRPPWRVASLIAILLLGAILSNLGVLREQARYLRGAGADTAAYLGTLDMTRAIISPQFPSAGFLLGVVQARDYFAAERELGTPAWTATELSRSDDRVRQAADRQLIAIHRLGLVPARPGAGGSCVRSGGGGALTLTLPAAGVTIRAQGGPADVAVRRFSTHFDELGSLSAGGSGLLRAGPDGATQPWVLRVTPTSMASACDVGS